MLIGADSWLPPTQEVLDQLKTLDGFTFYGGYVGGLDLYQNTPWPMSAWELLKKNEIEPLPIWVPKQDCTENPNQSADEALTACEKVGLSGVIAVDSEHSMSQIMNYQAWLDEFCHQVLTHGWHPVTYAGAHYVGQGSFAWLVAWGEHSEVPVSGEALQYGPYILRNNEGTELARLDADSADEHFPLASYVIPTGTVMPAPNNVIPIAPKPTNTGGSFTLNMPTLSETNPGPNNKNETVRALQNLLNLRLNCGLATDGFYGSKTASAVVELERTHSLTVDSGIAGPQVWSCVLAV